MAIRAKNCAIKRYRRLTTWDYSGGASFFITSVTEPRRSLFGQIAGGKVELNELGRAVKAALEAMLRLNPGLVSLRVSRQVAAPEAIAAVVRRVESAVDKGYIVICGFISKGERAVCDMLFRRRGARFIRMLPSCIPNRRFRPESRYVAPFAEERYLEIAKGNDEVEFGCGACLDINAEIIEIATAGEGLALYWKGDGPKVVARRGA